MIPTPVKITLFFLVVFLGLEGFAINQAHSRLNDLAVRITALEEQVLEDKCEAKSGEYQKNDDSRYFGGEEGHIEYLCYTDKIDEKAAQKKQGEYVQGSGTTVWVTFGMGSGGWTKMWRADGLDWVRTDVTTERF